MNKNDLGGSLAVDKGTFCTRADSKSDRCKNCLGQNLKYNDFSCLEIKLVWEVSRDILYMYV